MKTQITNLINGSNNVIRNMDDPKYITAKPATSHDGFAGTNREVREEVAARVHAENDGVMRVEAKGIALELPISYTTGKSWSWRCDITQEQYKALGGTHTAGNFKSYMLEVFGDCTVAIYSFTKRTEGSQWRQSQMTYVDESFITIL